MHWLKNLRLVLQLFLEQIHLCEIIQFRILIKNAVL